VRSRYSVIADVTAHIKVRITWLDQGVETSSYMWFIGSGPHLPLDPVVQVRFEPYTRPGRHNRTVSPHPTGKPGKGIYQAALARPLMPANSSTA
jgi:hypothetical protein